MVTDKIKSELRQQSFYYPEVLIKEYPCDNPLHEKYVFASTLIRIERNDKWYVLHCIESIIPTETVSERTLFLRLMESVHKIHHLYRLTGKYEEIDSLQISEEDRLCG